MVPRSDAGDRRRQDRSPADALPMYGRHRSPRTVLASTTTLWSPDCLSMKRVDGQGVILGGDLVAGEVVLISVSPPRWEDQVGSERPAGPSQMRAVMRPKAMRGALPGGRGPGW